MGTAGRYLLAEEVGAEHREERAGGTLGVLTGVLTGYLLAEEVGAEHREERAGEEAPVVPHREHLCSEAYG